MSFRAILSVLIFGVFSVTFAEDQMPVLQKSKKISVIGTGYVGLVLGASLAEWGHEVVCADILQDKIQDLQNGVIPFFEPGLNALVQSNVDANKLMFTSNIIEAIQSTDIVFIAVGTPSSQNGAADISALEAVAKVIGENLNGNKVVCIKSTIPIGTTRKIQKLLSSYIDPKNGYVCAMAFNPEFLREGTAIDDFFKTDRLVVGAEDVYVFNMMREMFKPLIDQNTTLIETSYESAEAIKYASNAFLATKISFINEFANLCDATGADVSVVAYGMGLDKRIGPAFLNPGPGYGGSCFPKDTLGLLHQGKELGVALKVVEATIEANGEQMTRVVSKIKALVGGSLSNKSIAILGLSFKANTDDIRCSPSISIIGQLLAEGAIINAYDPMAMNNMKKILPGVNYCESIDAASYNADVAVVLTDWEEIRELDLTHLIHILKKPILMDARNLYNPLTLSQLGYKFDNMGRGKSVVP